MTGLDRRNDKIMSICCYITSHDLQLLDDTGFEAIIQHDQRTLDAMGEWCRATHGRSGLTAACLASSTSPQAAATNLLAYIQKYVPHRQQALLAGNSVHADKDFLVQPPYNRIIEHLHYRIFDVSALKEAARRWASDDVLARVPAKKGLHQAREDVLESIEEARFYRDEFFTPKTG